MTSGDLLIIDLQNFSHDGFGKTIPFKNISDFTGFLLGSFAIHYLHGVHVTACFYKIYTFITLLVVFMYCTWYSHI